MPRNMQSRSPTAFAAESVPDRSNFPLNYKVCCGILPFWMHYGTMATLTIKNLPDDIYSALGEMAKRHRRSINGEAIVLLEKAVQTVEPDIEKRLERIRQLRDSLPGVWLTDEFLTLAKNEGRP